MKVVKLLFVLIVFFSFSFTALAQKKYPKEYELMRNVTSLNCYFDYSAMKVRKVKIKEYVSMKLNMDFSKFCTAVESIIKDSANEELEKKGMKIVDNDVSCEIEVKIMFNETDPDGEHEIMVRLVHKPSDTQISSFDIGSNGGSGDDFSEMFMNGLIKTGKSIGKKICKIKSYTDSTK